MGCSWPSHSHHGHSSAHYPPDTRQATHPLIRQAVRRHGAEDGEDHPGCIGRCDEGVVLQKA